MIPGLHGPLISQDFAERGLPRAFAGRLGEDERAAAARWFRLWRDQVQRTLGPASGIRTLFDCGAVPLLERLGFRAAGIRLLGSGGAGLARIESVSGSVAGLIVVPWEVDLGRVWQDAVTEGLALETRWCLCFNGVRLRLVDAERTWARRFLEIDLDAAADHPGTFATLWGLLRATALGSPVDSDSAPPLLDQAIASSDRHSAGVRESLQSGVEAALLHLVSALVRERRHGFLATARHTARGALVEASLTVIYRILFLLFAEARGLVPVWHPVYRDGYSMAALQAQAEAARQAPGLWETLQAITRLAHSGCQAGDLRVTPFNGRLFAPVVPLVDRVAAGRRRRGSRQARDSSLRDVLLALTTRPAGAGGRERIAYGDLGVEQLGAVYERVLDYEPAISVTSVDGTGRPVEGRHPSAVVVTLRSSGRRKATGTFYTPRSITDFLVRRTLHPLVNGRPPEAVLSLRVLDPAMGSGAFLVSACRYLAMAYERALVRAGAVGPDEVTDDDRAGFRRLVAQRCLYGVDLNPMAVQLGRLSLWLATLATDKPLTFLDHHLRAGNSLAGASPVDLVRRAPGPTARRERRHAQPSLFDTAALEAALADTCRPRTRLAVEPGDSLEAVRGKERLFDRLDGPQAPLAAWRRVVDLWCAAWFWPRRGSPSAGEFWALADQLLQGHSVLAAHVSGPRLDLAAQVAAEHAFFHWTLEFPEVFFDEGGHRLPDAGFDAVLGNPPWEMLRADGQREAAPGCSRESIARFVRFVRESGVYALQGTGHQNLYQLFLERALSLTRRGGRVGMVLPAGLLSDHGSTTLRRHLLAQCDTDTLVSFDNRDGIFPIHRSVRFVLLAASTGRPTANLQCRFGERSPSALDALPDAVADQAAAACPIVLSEARVRRLSGDSLTIPEFRSPIDLAIVEKVAAAARPLGHPGGWAVRFGRELNATDDRHHFEPPGRGLPVLDGRALRPFQVAISSARFSLPSRVARRLLDRASTFGRPRLAYRDVASSTNRLTLIAAIVPANVVTTHTVFCLKGDLDPEAQLCLCGLLNSYVTNYLVRQRVSTHVSASILEQVPVPRPARDCAAFTEMASLAARLGAGRGDGATEARLQARAAVLYGLTHDEFTWVLETFPLVEFGSRQAALEAFAACYSSRESVFRA